MRSDSWTALQQQSVLDAVRGFQVKLGKVADQNDDDNIQRVKNGGRKVNFEIYPFNIRAHKHDLKPITRSAPPPPPSALYR